ncbi:MAG: OmpA family protein [Rhizobiales bacterium]|nr:OmpA family protein [Hyphomicrobiales bacterium]MBO6698318.1 OmpA family protein [Hyphomicrobiales bacterium]MBO6735428.1 OmpA family protein [Hyphomicrobiales bacterium]MBO6910764.1 OmpA family protein [Hyphomicrobiales bacterium]MBO6956773.1 OmpA family protein [Hyphomicrobiales bacterium]
MCNWRGWLLPGLLTLIVLTAIAVLVRGGPIEADLTARSLQMLEADGTPWASATLDGRDATLSGTAPTLAAQTAALAAIERVAGVYRIDSSGLEVLPLADPYTLTLAVDGQSATVSGSFPDGVMRASLLDGMRALIGDKTLVDETVLARGAPVGFDELASFAIAGLPVLESGTVTLDGSMLSLTGDAATVVGYHAELERLAAPPAALTLGEIALNPPIVSPYTWSAEATDGGVTLSGFVPDDATRAAVINAAEPFGAVTDTMEIGFGAPDGFPDAALALLAQMEGLDNTSASITDRDLTLAGEAADSDAYNAANAFLGSLPTGFDSLSGRIAPPIADPFITSLARDSDGYTLTGVLPDETARAVILDAIGGDARDTSVVARGAPDGVEVGDVFSSIATVFDDMIDGTATMTANSLAVSGTAANFSGASEAETALLELANNALSVETDIVPGPATPFTFSTQTSDESLLLQGFAPTGDARDTIVTSATDLFPGYAVTNELVIADGGPDGFLTMVQAGLSGLARLANGSFDISDTEARLSGGAFYESLADRVAQQVLSAGSSGFDFTADIGLAPPPPAVDAETCQARFGALLSANTIRFETGSAAIDRQSDGLLDRLVRTLQSCPDASVLIGGHTDSQGDSIPNMRLSQGRAMAVRDYVVDAGIPEERLLAVGFGESEPIADNGTDEGRALNRRIEFTVQR